MMSILTHVASQAAADGSEDALERYASSPLFRSATVDELVIQGNPYRRPVRPGDLEIIDLRTPVSRARAFELKSLIAHRLLLNLNESDLVLLPPPDAEASVWDDFATFYSPESRSLGERARPILEASVFGLLAEVTAPPDLYAHVTSVEDRRRREGSPVAAAIAPLQDRRLAAAMYLCQIACTSLLAQSIWARGFLGDLGTLRPTIDEHLAQDEQTAVRALLESCGLDGRPHAYWQFYLASSMALVNYLHLVSRDRSALYWLLGALAHQCVVQDVRAAQESEMLRDAFGSAVDLRLFRRGGGRPSVFDRLLRPVIDRCGPRCLEGLALGFEHMRTLQAIADEDFAIQVAWADRRAEYQERARRIYDGIERSGVEVDRDTFIESCEETSTTHVHDVERLLVIESGVMHFWNRPGERIEFRPGDVMLVPYGRLHGSTVLSGQCVYHQPIITPDVMAAIDGASGPR